MSVIERDHQERLLEELGRRVGVLISELKGRPLIDKHEGAGTPTAYWTNPDRKVYVDALKLSLAAGDFAVVLAEIKKIKG